MAHPAGPAATVRLVVDDRWATFARMAMDSVRGQLAHEESGIPFSIDYRVEEPATKPMSAFTFIFPGLIAMALLQLGLFATAAPLLTARDRGPLRHCTPPPPPPAAPPPPPTPHTASQHAPTPSPPARRPPPPDHLGVDTH